VDLILALLLARFDAARRQLAAHHHADDGYSVEAVAVIALLVVLALAVIGTIAVKVRAKANSINLDGNP
jgi:hypothetical protein